MPCRVPKRRFSCGAPQHLTKNQNNVITFIPIEGANHPFQNPKQMALAIHEIVEFFGE